MWTATLIIQIRRSELAVMLMVIADPENPVDAWTMPPVTVARPPTRPIAPSHLG
jgi:hypothetical protein